MNPKAKGEKGQRIVIGELAKLDIDVAIPLSDNLPFDLIICYANKLYKAQVKSSNYGTSEGSLDFNLRTNNWHKKTIKKYCTDDCDLFLLTDYNSVYALGPSEFVNRCAFTIRQTPSTNNQTKNCNNHESYVLSHERLKKVLNL